MGGTVAPSTMVMLYNSTGVFLVAPGGTITGAAPSCIFPRPVPWPPWPATIGRRVVGQANCTGAVGSYQVTGQVQGAPPLPLDGKTVDTAVVVNTILITGTVNGGAFRVSLTETDSYAPGLGVPVQTKTHVAATVLGLSLAMDRVDSLESATPS